MSNKIIGAILIVIALLVLSVVGYAQYSGNIQGTNPDGTSVQLYKYECDLTVEEKFIGQDLSITSYQCQNTGEKCRKLFNLFTSEGVIELWDDSGKVSSKSFKTGLFSGDDKITIDGCSSGQGLKVKLYDEDHNFIEEKVA